MTVVVFDLSVDHLAGAVVDSEDVEQPLLRSDGADLLGVGFVGLVLGFVDGGVGAAVACKTVFRDESCGVEAVDPAGSVVAPGQQLAVEIVRVEQNVGCGLFDVVEAGGPPRSGACLIQGGKQHRRQDCDDRNHDQKLNQRKPAERTSFFHIHLLFWNLHLCRHVLVARGDGSTMAEIRDRAPPAETIMLISFRF